MAALIVPSGQGQKAVDDRASVSTLFRGQKAGGAEAAAQSLPIHGLGSRPGATEASAEFDVLLDRVLDEGAMP